MTRLKKITGMLLCLATAFSFSSCGELMDELFGGDDEPIQNNYEVALAGEWRVVKAGLIENPAGEMAYVNDSETVPESLEKIELTDGTAHFYFSQEIVLNRQSTSGSMLPPETVTEYICPCYLGSISFENFEFGFENDETGTHEYYKEWVPGEDGTSFSKSANIWAYGRDDDYATKLILYCTTDTRDYGYELERYE